MQWPIPGTLQTAQEVRERVQQQQMLVDNPVGTLVDTPVDTQAHKKRSTASEVGHQPCFSAYSPRPRWTLCIVSFADMRNAEAKDMMVNRHHLAPLPMSCCLFEKNLS